MTGSAATAVGWQTMRAATDFKSPLRCTVANREGDPALYQLFWPVGKEYVSGATVIPMALNWNSRVP